MKESDFDRYAETFFDQLHEGHDYEEIARGYGEYYYDCLPGNKDASILDVGCGAGQFLRFLELQGYTHTEGIELSSQQAEWARQHVKCPVHLGDVGDLLKEKGPIYSVVSLNDVLEHIPKSMTVHFLKLLGSGLCKGGSVIVNVPQVSGMTTAFNRYNDFTHQLVFTEMSLRQVLLMAGYKEVRFIPEYWPIKWTPRHLAYRLVRWLWYKLLRLVYFIEMPGERAPSHWQVRLVAVAKK